MEKLARAASAPEREAASDVAEYFEHQVLVLEEALGLSERELLRAHG